MIVKSAGLCAASQYMLQFFDKYCHSFENLDFIYNNYIIIVNSLSFNYKSFNSIAQVKKILSYRPTTIL